MRFRHAAQLILIGFGLALAPAAPAAIVPADVVNIDFNTTNEIRQNTNVFGPPGTFTPSGTYVGLAAGPATAGTFWNPVVLGFKDALTTAVRTFDDFGPTAPLKASDGTTTTTVTVALGNASQYDATENGSQMFAKPLLTDYAFIVNSTATFTLSGLNDRATYDLYLYSQNGGHSNGITTFNIGAASAVVDNVTNATANRLGFVLGGNYVKFTGLTPTSGSITGSFNNNLNAIQLVLTSVALPEPTAALLGLTTLPLILRPPRRC
jgi:hypothetical protein